MRRNYLYVLVLILFSFLTMSGIYSNETCAQQKTPPPTPKVQEPPKQALLDIARAVRQQSRELTRAVRIPPPPEVLYLDEEQEAEALNFINQTDSKRAEELMVLKERSPENYRIQLSLAFREMRELQRLKEDDPERYERVVKEKELNRKSYELVELYRKTTSEEEKKSIRTQLENLLDTLFDYRQMNREEEIERLEKQVAELKEINNKRIASKKEIVLNRLAEMLGEKSGLEW